MEEDSISDSAGEDAIDSDSLEEPGDQTIQESGADSEDAGIEAEASEPEDTESEQTEETQDIQSAADVGDPFHGILWQFQEFQLVRFQL